MARSRQQRESDEADFGALGLFGAVVGMGVAAMASQSDCKEDREWAEAFGQTCGRGAVRAATRLQMSEARIARPQANKLFIGACLAELAYASSADFRKKFREIAGPLDMTLVAQSRDCDADVGRWFLVRGEANDGLQKALWLVFRGTTSKAETLLDLAAVPIPFGDDKVVHAGFQHAAELILERDEDFKQARRLIKRELSSYPLNLVGHSLGGAIAMVVASDLQNKANYNRGEVLMYGSPPVHHQYSPSTSDLGFDVTLVVNDSDVVPRALSSDVDTIRELFPKLLGNATGGNLGRAMGKAIRECTSGWVHPSGMNLYVIGPNVVTEVPDGIHDSWLSLDACHGWGDPTRWFMDHMSSTYKVELAKKLGVV